ncbi:MAG: FeoA family protein [Sneathiella sp.]
MLGFGKTKQNSHSPTDNRFLHEAKKDLDHKICGIEADKGLSHKLMEMGLPIGSIIQILQHRPCGGAIVAKGNLRLALGSSLTSQIIVLPV